MKVGEIITDSESAHRDEEVDVHVDGIGDMTLIPVFGLGQASR